MSRYPLDFIYAAFLGKLLVTDAVSSTYDGNRNLVSKAVPDGAFHPQSEYVFG